MSFIRHLFARPPAQPAVRKVVMDVSMAGWQRLEWLRMKTDASDITEVISDALELREAVVKLMIEGKRILVHDPATGKQYELIDPS